MPNTYTINLINKTKASRFAFFQAPPKVKFTSKGGSASAAEGGSSAENVFSNVWVAKGCDAGGQVTVTATLDFYSWAGDATEKAAIGVNTSSGKALSVTLGVEDTPGTTIDVSVDSKDIVVSKQVKATATGGNFEIITQPFTAAKSVIIGMAKPDVDDPRLFRPTATINASANMVYSIKPINNFYVSKWDIDFSVGQIFDFKAVSDQKGLISFSDNPGTSVATVICDDEGLFTVSYN